MSFQNVYLILVLGFCTNIRQSDGNRAEDLLVETTKGKIHGFRDHAPTAEREEVDCWFGIPYAKPPVGDLKFLHPQPMDYWSEVKETQKLPHACPQVIDDAFPGFIGAEMWKPNTNISDDCLYLNIVAPSKRRSFLPVMVWIHGGGFVSGSSTLDIYNPRTLAATQDVVVVSIQYRLASPGFLYFGTEDAPGNAGLFDQLMALQFVKENIERVRGDPDNITLFGMSAGAASVALHLLSPLSRNLFNRAILQSGSATAPWALISKEESITRGLRLAEAVGCPNDTNRIGDIASCLRSVNSSKLVRNEWRSQKINQFPFVPVVDGKFLTEMPEESLKNGGFKNTSLLLGSNLDEGTFFLFYYLPTIFKNEENVVVDRETFLQSVPKLNPYLSEIPRHAIIFEYTDWSSPNDPIRNRDNLDKMVGDQHFTCPVTSLALKYAEAGCNVYMYRFSHRSSQNPWPKWAGVMHGDETSFVFGHSLDPSKGYTEEEVELSRLMMRYWATFAKTGKPGDETEWPEHSVQEREYLEFNGNRTNPAIGRGVRLKECAFWDYLPQLVNASATHQDGVGDQDQYGWMGIVGLLFILGVILVPVLIAINRQNKQCRTRANVDD